MNRLTQGRTALFDALKPLLPDGRVTQRVPAQIVPPCIWIEAAQLAPQARGTSSTVLVGTYPVVAAVDGSQDAQTLGTDDLTAAIWDAVESVAGANAVDAFPTTLDVGGPTLRAVTVNVALSLRGRGLCLPDPSTPDP